MIVEYAYLRILPGREDEFERSFDTARPILTGAHGCVSATLSRDVEHPSSYLLRVTWQTLADHLETFPASAAGRRFAEHVAPYFDGDPQVRHFAAADVSE